MKSSIIIKALAFAMLMPALLFTAACSSDFINDEGTDQKGFTLPVTVKVTYQSDPSTKATFDDGTKKLSFSAGDKLFVWGSHNKKAGRFAGTLDYDESEGKFSGTITTEYNYPGTAETLLEDGSTHAILLPAGYKTYGYLSITDNNAYDAEISYDATKALATSKAVAVEQFTYEAANEYSSGFALSPQRAILNFTITGLKASTVVTAVLKKSGSQLVTGSVKTDGSGTATFAIGGETGSNINLYSLTVGGKDIPFTSSDKVLEKGKIYNITRTVAPALSAVTSADVGSVITADGYAYPAKTPLPAGKTAVGILGKVTSDGHGLILALTDATTLKWYPIEGWSSVTAYAGTTLKLLPDDERGSLTNYTSLGSTTVSDWCVAQKRDYEAIFNNLGSTTGDNDGKTFDDSVNAYITTGVGGTALYGDYWSATRSESYYDHAWLFSKYCWSGASLEWSCHLRPVLGF